MKVSSTKPYLIRAIYDWCVDNGLTVYISAVIEPETSVPEEHVLEGEITLNISPAAVRELLISNDVIHFIARFNGNSREISIPVNTVKAVFAKEINQGLFFSPESEQKKVNPVESEDTRHLKSESGSTQKHDGERNRDHLKIVR